MRRRKVLLKDIIIPAGTVFNTAPWKTTRDDTHYDCVIGLSDNTCGSFTYCIDPDFSNELEEYFKDLGEIDMSMVDKPGRGEEAI